MNWTAAETNTHQDHVIAHVVGATPLGYYVLDETAYILLDIGFIWNIYLDMEMGLLPHPLTISELEVDENTKSELRSDVDALMRGETPTRMTAIESATPIRSTELLRSDNASKLVLICEDGKFVIEMSLEHRSTRMSQIPDP